MSHLSHDHSMHDHQVATTVGNASSSLTTVAPQSVSSTYDASHSGNHDSHVGRHSSHVGGGMKMFFHGGCSEVILFDWWRIDSYAGLLVSCLFVFLLAAAYESIKWFRIYYQMSYANGNGRRPQPAVTLSATAAGVEEALIQNADMQGTSNDNHRSSPSGGLETLSRDQVYVPTVISSGADRSTRSRIDSFRQSFQSGVSECVYKLSGYKRAFEALLYGLQLVVAYFLMLIAMTYNTYLFMAVVAGATVSHWLFASLKCLFSPTAAGGGSAPLLPTSDPSFVTRADNFASDACH